MNLLTVIHYPIFGGPHNEALRLHGALRAHGYETTVLLPAEPGNAAERLRAAGVPVVQRPLRRLRANPDPRVSSASWPTSCATSAAFAASFGSAVSTLSC
ncbi:MAG: hypothetical protein U0531_02635 [Dehalococcoidia bacterium]